MEETFDYSRVPSYFVHCFNAQCPRAGECLRQLAGRHVTALRPVVQAVSPAVWESEGRACAYFQPIRRVRMAWGMRQAIARLPYREGQWVVKKLNRMFTKATLNRISHHQRPLSPDEQRVIESMFAEYGVTDGNVFDRVEMGYDWRGVGG